MAFNAQDGLSKIPHKPGVYQFINADGEIIYVGKAKDLRKRVASYFNRNTYDSAKLRVLIAKTEDVKHIVVNTESDALLLENNLIKRYKPKYNILLKDDKTYPWICIKNEPFPRVFTTRRLVEDGSKYFGPYTSGLLLKTILDLVRSIYPLRTCSLPLTNDNISKGKFKTCLEFQLGNCKAPCVGNQDQREYNNNINAIIEILKGNIISVNSSLKRQMHLAAKSYRYEEAQYFKEKLEILKRFQAKTTIVNPRTNNLDVFSIVFQSPYAYVNYLKVVKGSIVQSHNVELKQGLEETEDEMLGFAVAEVRSRMQSSSREVIVPFVPDFKLDDCRYTKPSRGDKKMLLDLSFRNAKSYANEKQRDYDRLEQKGRDTRILTTLKNDLKLETLPVHIECFDNSNLQGTNPVAACVVFRNAKPSKKDYRHFNIKTVVGPDDFASMKEVVYRRYHRMIMEGQPLPQLIVIDGGKGQLNFAFSALKDLSIEEKVKIIGIAKRLEEIFSPGDSTPLYLDKSSESLKLIQHIRNEAHRFGIKHHRTRREKEVKQSNLISIPGIGEKTVQALFKQNKTLESMAKLPLDVLIDQLGESKAKKIFEYFKKLNAETLE